MTITDDIVYVGVNDKDLDLFEGAYPVPNGMAYNSYIIFDDKIAVMDTVDKRKTDEYLANVKEALNGRKPDYLVVHHAEPDHAASLKAFMDLYPDTQIVATARAVKILGQYFDLDLSGAKVVEEGDTLSLGKHQLQFVMAPMVHWPEVMMTYDATDKALFSADAFGKFGTLDVDEEWDCEARRYYFNICGKFGKQVQALLQKAAKLDIRIICPLHGPVLTENLDYYLNKYDIWSRYAVEDDVPFIAYCSIYGNTKKVALKLQEMLQEKYDQEVEIEDLARDDISEALENAFRCSKLVLLAPSLDGGVMSVMEDYLNHLKAKNYQNRTVAIVQNGSFGPSAARAMRGILDTMKGISYIEPDITIWGALKDSDMPALEELVDKLTK